MVYLNWNNCKSSFCLSWIPIDLIQNKLTSIFQKHIWKSVGMWLQLAMADTMVIKYVGEAAAGTKMRNTGGISWFVGEKIESWSGFALWYAIAAIARAQTGPRSGKLSPFTFIFCCKPEPNLRFSVLGGIWRWSSNTSMSSSACRCRITDWFRRFASPFARILGLVWTNTRTKFNGWHRLLRSVEKIPINWNGCTPFIRQWIARFNLNHTICHTKSHGNMGLSIEIGPGEPLA